MTPHPLITLGVDAAPAPRSARAAGRAHAPPWLTMLSAPTAASWSLTPILGLKKQRGSCKVGRPGRCWDPGGGGGTGWPHVARAPAADSSLSSQSGLGLWTPTTNGFRGQRYVRGPPSSPGQEGLWAMGGRASRAAHTVPCWSRTAWLAPWCAEAFRSASLGEAPESCPPGPASPPGP